MRGGIVYISSNREDPKFEQNVIEDILSKKGDLPVFSVTQKPMYTTDGWGSASHTPDGLTVQAGPFGSNICVGDVGASGFNFCRQLQMATELADVDYVISCEADCLYSPDYFEFVPPKLDAVYRNTNNYVIPYKQDAFYSKDSQTAFQVAGRDFLLDRLNFLLKGQPQWNTKMKNFPKEIGQPFLEGWETFKTEYGCFQIKTGKGMRLQTRHGKEPIESLPYWGTAKKVKERYL